MEKRTILSLGLGILAASYYLVIRTRERRRMFAVGIDFGGTNVKFGLVDRTTGKVVSHTTLPVAPSRHPDDLVDQLVNGARDLLKHAGKSWNDVYSLGVCCPGRIENGLVSTVANLKGWKDIPLRTLLKERSGLSRVEIANDANAALLGELWCGSLKGCKHAILMTLGTGVGTGICSEGMILKGSTGMFGEIGHQIMCIDGRLSVATNVKGIAEEYCSVRALQLFFVEHGGPPNTDAREIIENAQKGSDQRAVDAVLKFSKHVGVLIVNAARAYDPEKIAVGGGLGESDFLLDLCSKAALNLQWSLAGPTYQVVKAQNGNLAGLIGASYASLTSQ